jgi:hypothetical protein
MPKEGDTFKRTAESGTFISDITRCSAAVVFTPVISVSTGLRRFLLLTGFHFSLVIRTQKWSGVWILNS